MTTTDDETLALLLQALDADPDDRLLLLVIADRCDEIEWGSGDGWRAMHRLKRQPHYWISSKKWGWVKSPSIVSDYYWTEYCRLHRDWFALLPEYPDLPDHWCTTWVSLSRTYREAADAFLRLPADRRRELLTGEKPC